MGELKDGEVGKIEWGGSVGGGAGVRWQDSRWQSGLGWRGESAPKVGEGGREGHGDGGGSHEELGLGPAQDAEPGSKAKGHEGELAALRQQDAHLCGKGLTRRQKTVRGQKRKV